MGRNRVSFGRRRAALAAAGLAVGAMAVGALAVGCDAAELPSQARKAKPQEAAAARKCNVGGITGIVAANGVCVRLSGSVTAGVGAGSLK